MANKTVTVACKLPNGLNLGPLTPDGKPVILNGARHSTSGMAGGFGLTSGVDAEGFAKWLADHAEFEPVKKGLIFCSERRDHVLASGAERTAERTGFEGVDPEKPPPGIEETEESKKARRTRREEPPEDVGEG